MQLAMLQPATINNHDDVSRIFSFAAGPGTGAITTPNKFDGYTTEKKNAAMDKNAAAFLSKGMISRDQEHLTQELATPQLGSKNKRISKESYEDDLTRQLLADSGDEVEAIKEE